MIQVNISRISNFKNIKFKEHNLSNTGYVPSKILKVFEYKKKRAILIGDRTFKILH